MDFKWDRPFYLPHLLDELLHDYGASPVGLLCPEPQANNKAEPDGDDGHVSESCGGK